MRFSTGVKGRINLCLRWVAVTIGVIIRGVIDCGCSAGRFSAFLGDVIVVGVDCCVCGSSIAMGIGFTVDSDISVNKCVVSY